MVTCCAFGCTNRASMKIPGITFHCFPRNVKQRQRWIIAVRRANFVPSSYSVVCSAHFTEDMIDRTCKRVRIRENAVPNIFDYVKKKRPYVRKVPDSCTKNFEQQESQASPAAEIIVPDSLSKHQDHIQQDFQEQPAAEIVSDSPIIVMDSQQELQKLEGTPIPDVVLDTLLSNFKDSDVTKPALIVEASGVTCIESILNGDNKEMSCNTQSLESPSSDFSKRKFKKQKKIRESAIENDFLKRKVEEQEKVIDSLRKKIKVLQQKARQDEVNIHDLKDLIICNKENSEENNSEENNSEE